MKIIIQFQDNLEKKRIENNKQRVILINILTINKSNIRFGPVCLNFATFYSNNFDGLNTNKLKYK